MQKNWRSQKQQAQGNETAGNQERFPSCLILSEALMMLRMQHELGVSLIMLYWYGDYLSGYESVM